MVPWKTRKLLIWDTTCSPDTFVPSHCSSTTREAGAVATLAEERKMRREVHQWSQPHTCLYPGPVAVEMYSWGLWTTDLGVLESWSGSPAGSRYWRWDLEVYQLPPPKAFSDSSARNSASVLGTTGQLSTPESFSSLPTFSFSEVVLGTALDCTINFAWCLYFTLLWYFAINNVHLTSLTYNVYPHACVWVDQSSTCSYCTPFVSCILFIPSLCIISGLHAQIIPWSSMAASSPLK